MIMAAITFTRCMHKKFLLRNQYWLKCDPQNWYNWYNCIGEGALIVMIQLMLQAPDVPNVPTVVTLTWPA